jgi:hypothetical protein
MSGVTVKGIIDRLPGRRISATESAPRFEFLRIFFSGASSFEIAADFVGQLAIRQACLRPCPIANCLEQESTFTVLDQRKYL